MRNWNVFITSLESDFIFAGSTTQIFSFQVYVIFKFKALRIYCFIQDFIHQTQLIFLHGPLQITLSLSRGKSLDSSRN